MAFQKKRQVFINGDLNALAGYGYIPLRNSSLIKLLQEYYGDIHNGMKIWLFALTERNNKYDPTIFPGIIRDIGEEDEYQIEVDEKNFEYLSESTKFKDYSIEEVIGDNLYTEISKKRPELL